MRRRLGLAFVTSEARTPTKVLLKFRENLSKFSIFPKLQESIKSKWEVFVQKEKQSCRKNAFRETFW